MLLPIKYVTAEVRNSLYCYKNLCEHISFFSSPTLLYCQNTNSEFVILTKLCYLFKTQKWTLFFLAEDRKSVSYTKLRRPRNTKNEYMTLVFYSDQMSFYFFTNYKICWFNFRDTTVQTLTLQPSVKDGLIVYEDSPLVSNAIIWIFSTVFFEW